jgi:beta-N-acetylhexosaminidase
MAGVDGTTLTPDARHVISDLHVGNVILMGGNIASPGQVLALTQSLQALAMQSNGIPLLIGTDQEGGSVQRLSSDAGFTALPDAVTVGDAGRPDLSRTYGKMVGDEMAAVGVNLDFAPDLDVNDNPANPVIGPRAFGITPDVVVANGLAFANGLRDAGVIAIGKHFPGHGNTSVNSHLALPVVNKTLAQLQATEFKPFQAGINDGIDGLMVAHVAYPALDPSGLPATVSAPIVQDFLRGQLAFGGVVFTDDMGMKGIADVMSLQDAAVKAIADGIDVLLCVRQGEDTSCKPGDVDTLHKALVDAVNDGRLSHARIDQAFAHVEALKKNYRAGAASGAGLAQVGSPQHAAIVQQIEAAAGH